MVRLLIGHCRHLWSPCAALKKPDAQAVKEIHSSGGGKGYTEKTEKETEKKSKFRKKKHGIPFKRKTEKRCVMWWLCHPQCLYNFNIGYFSVRTISITISQILAYCVWALSSLYFLPQSICLVMIAQLSVTHKGQYIEVMCTGTPSDAVILLSTGSENMLDCEAEETVGDYTWQERKNRRKQESFT